MAIESSFSIANKLVASVGNKLNCFVDVGAKLGTSEGNTVGWSELCLSGSASVATDEGVSVTNSNGDPHIRYSGGADDSSQIVFLMNSNEELVRDPTPGKLEAQLTENDTAPTWRSSSGVSPARMNGPGGWVRKAWQVGKVDDKGGPRYNRHL